MNRPSLAAPRPTVRWRALWFASVVGCATAAPLNVLFLVVDDFRPALGCYGDPLAHTPKIDRLAARGLIFERAYAQEALCGPSRASVLTGRRPGTFPAIAAGHMEVHYRATLPNVVTLPQMFKEQGWHTESIGKVNHTYPPIYDPPSWSEPEHIFDIPKRDEYLSPENRTRGFIDPMSKGTATESLDVPDDAYQDGQAAQLAIESLARLKDQPFFLALGFKRPHLPWTAPKKYWQLFDQKKFALHDDYRENHAFPWRFEWWPGSGEMRNYTDVPRDTDISPDKTAELRQGYYASVAFIDAQVGRVIAELDRLKLTDNTIIVLWGDQGYHLGENGQWGKKTNTELDLRVPLIVIAPGHTHPATRTSALVELLDLFPTLAQLAQAAPPPGLEGTSLIPLLAEPRTQGREAVFSEYTRGPITGRSVRNARYRFNEWSNVKSGQIVDRELYDITTDPLQRRNLATDPAHAELARSLAALRPAK
jgi:iduronate 2-sulfatase